MLPVCPRPALPATGMWASRQVRVNLGVPTITLARMALLLVVQTSRSTRLGNALAASHLQHCCAAATMWAAARSAECICAPASPEGTNNNTSHDAPPIHKPRALYVHRVGSLGTCAILVPKSSLHTRKGDTSSQGSTGTKNPQHQTMT